MIQELGSQERPAGSRVISMPRRVVESSKGQQRITCCGRVLGITVYFGKDQHCGSLSFLSQG